MTEPISAINVGNFNNRYVKVFFNNGAGCEGLVVLWSDDRSVLLDESSGNLLYIYNTKNNVMMVKVLAEKKTNGPTVEAVDHKRDVLAEPDDGVVIGAPPVTPFVEPDPPKLDYDEPDQNLRLKKLAKLKDMRTEAMKDQFSNRLKTFTPTQLMPAYYDTPNFTK
jgi:hypothetical protein